MDLEYGETYERLREEVRTFLEAHWSPSRLSEASRKREAEAIFRRQAVAAGYLYRSVPAMYGGSEQPPDVLKAQVIREEFARARAPAEMPGVGTAMLVPTLLEFGTDEQKERFISKTLSGEYRWAQGYSEPNAGSDLASLKTRGELLGDEWVINGQKIWSTLAQHAHYMFVLVRTEPDAVAKQAGISYLLVDLKQRGITIRPLKQLTGAAEFCEIFFDDVRTPSTWIVGARGAGWKVSKATLSHERSSLGGSSTSVALFDKLLDLARRTSYEGQPAIRNPMVRERLAILDGYVQSHLYSSYRQLSMSLRGQGAGPIEYMNKLINTQIGHDTAKIAKDLVGDNLLLAPPLQSAKGAGSEKWLNQYFGSLGIAIAGGTSNIQRNVIAERGYGLPRDDTGQD